MFQLEDKPRGNSYTLISIVIPVYNQERAISTALARIRKVLDSLSTSYELIIVNDGSRDGTLQILQREQMANPALRVVSYDRNMGKGYAVKAGIVESKGEIVLFTDGDLDISPARLLDYIQELETSDLVVGSKRHALSKVKAPSSRKFLSKAFNAIVRIFTGIKIKDTQAGLKAGNGAAMRTIFNLMLVKRYAFDVELLTIAGLLKLQIKEMPIEINLDRKFKVKDIWRMFLDVMAISYRYRITKWYQNQLAFLAQVD